MKRPIFKRILKRVGRRNIKAELTPVHFIRNTRHADNEIYEITGLSAPFTMQEIGRLREIAFRESGGGTGQEVDIDEFDICANPFRQLIVWSAKDREIISGYRYILGKDILVTSEKVHSPVAELFTFSEEFIRNYLPRTIELGRSFVQPKFQASRRGIFSLDNIWDGLGAIIALNPDVQYLYGKMTMYKNYNKLARDLILFFLQKHFPPKKELFKPVRPLKFHHNKTMLASILAADSYAEDYKLLLKQVENLCCRIPPLINIYMGLSQTMECFGTVDNKAFGNVEETLILLKVTDIDAQKMDRYVGSFLKQREDSEESPTMSERIKNLLPRLRENQHQP
jgi:hypothetical protein